MHRYIVVRAIRDVAAGEEVLISYGERCDRHFFLYYGGAVQVLNPVDP